MRKRPSLCTGMCNVFNTFLSVLFLGSVGGTFDRMGGRARFIDIYSRCMLSILTIRFLVDAILCLSTQQCHRPSVAPDGGQCQDAVAVSHSRVLPVLVVLLAMASVSAATTQGLQFVDGKKIMSSTRDIALTCS